MHPSVLGHLVSPTFTYIIDTQCTRKDTNLTVKDDRPSPPPFARGGCFEKPRENAYILVLGIAKQGEGLIDRFSAPSATLGQSRGGSAMRGKYDVPGETGAPVQSPSENKHVIFGPPRPQPRVVLLSLGKQSFFDEMYAELLSSLRARALVEEITTLDTAVRILNADAGRPNAVLVTDGAITSPANAVLSASVARYARIGGTVIMMGHFSSFTRPPTIKLLFAFFGLPWEAGDYHRTTFYKNPAAQHLPILGLPQSSSQKSLHLRNVSVSDAVYLPTRGARTESLVFSTPVDDLSQTPVAFTSIGRGKVGYIGDVNAESEMNMVILAMCGLSP